MRRKTAVAWLAVSVAVCVIDEAGACSSVAAAETVFSTLPAAASNLSVRRSIASARLARATWASAA
jgi:hypothetical protein